MTPQPSPPPLARLVFPSASRLHDSDRILVGGSPLTALRLSEAGARAVGRWQRGEAVPSSPAEWKLARRLMDLGLAHPEPASPSRPGSDISVVIPVLNDAEGLRATVSSLLGARTTPATILIVDDGSTEPVDTSPWHDKPVRIRVVRNSTALGPAAARNRGLDLVTTPLVAFVDANVTVPVDWLDRLTPHFADPELAAVAPRVRSALRDHRTARYDRHRSPLDLGAEPGPVGDTHRIRYVPTACLLARTEPVRSVSFDEELRFGEDVDLGWRLNSQGWGLRYEPSIEVEHEPRPSLAELWKQRFNYGSSASPLAARYGSRLAPAVLPAEYLAASCAAVARKPLLAAAFVAAPTARMVIRLRRNEIPTHIALGVSASASRSMIGHAGRALASAWWPLSLGATLMSRRARSVGLPLAVAGLTASRVRGPERSKSDADGSLSPGFWAIHRLVDALSYGAGVWSGAARERRLEALKPRIIWPSDA